MLQYTSYSVLPRYASSVPDNFSIGACYAIILESNHWIRQPRKGGGSKISFSHSFCQKFNSLMFSNHVWPIDEQNIVPISPNTRFSCAQRAFPLRHSFKMLCVAHISDHSLRQASNPRRINLSIPRASLTWPNTGSTVWPPSL